jgi:hypothetical protein
MGWFFTITEEMRQWGLSGNELLVFALVNTFSQKAQGCYWGSLEYTCECCGISRATAIRTFNTLIGKGLITKNKIVTGDKVQTIYVATAVSKCDSQSQNDTSGGLKMTPNIEDRYINKDSLYKKGGHHFQKPSLDDIREYCISRSNKVDPEQFFNFYESKGWVVGKSPMKDWRAAVRTWEKREKEIPQRKRATRQESVLEHNLKVMDQLYGTNLHAQAYGGQADE